MADSETKTGGEQERVRLSKEQRKELLAQLERHSSRKQTPERLLQRGEQALESGQLDQAQRILKHLESRAPGVAGLASFGERLSEVAGREKRRVNIQTTEEMLTRYIQQRKKPLAELALETLLELVPNHPRRSDYEIWVADLDQEVALQKRIDEQHSGGRVALQTGDLAVAERHLEALRKLDPYAPATETFAEEVDAAQQGQEETADIERLKQEVEKLLEAGKLEEAERELARLGGMDVPKVTIDFLRKRLEATGRRRAEAATARAFETELRKRLAARDWQGARDIAQQYGKRFRGSPRSTELFHEVNRLEAGERRQQSVLEGVATFERFLAEGKRREAELALKLLHSLEVDPAQLAELKRRVEQL